MSYLFLLICAILLTFAKFELSSDEYTLINGQIDEYPKHICEYELGHEWTLNYNGTNGTDDSEQEFNIPCNGNYKIELWGAQ